MQNLEKFNTINLLEKLKNNLNKKNIINLKGDGWNELIYELHRKLVMLDENYKIIKISNDNDILNIKIFCKHHPPAVFNAIKRYTTRAIAESRFICIYCGDSKFIKKNNNEIDFFCKNCLSGNSGR